MNFEIIVSVEGTDDIAEAIRRVKDAFADHGGGLSVAEEAMISKLSAHQYTDQDLQDLAALKKRIDEIEQKLT